MSNADGRFDLVLGIVGLLLLLELAIAIACVVWSVSVYLSSPKPRSRLFRVIVRDDIIKAVAASWIAIIVVWRLSGAVVPWWVTPISAVATGALLWPVIDHALTFRRLRQKYGNGTPPPFHQED